MRASTRTADHGRFGEMTELFLDKVLVAIIVGDVTDHQKKKARAWAREVFGGHTAESLRAHIRLVGVSNMTPDSI